MYEKQFLRTTILRIGLIASPAVCKNEISYGLVLILDTKQVNELYSAASMIDYIPEEDKEFVTSYLHN